MERVSKIVQLHNSITENDTKTVWVFGYGSLCWLPGFHFEKAIVGRIKGYSRKFWQGNDSHRGTKDQPGRVATLVKENDGIVHGIAFQLSGENALAYLNERECKLGGYIAELTNFYPAFGSSLTAILYIATDQNDLWLGDAPLGDIASQITNCKGNSGYNVEYLLRLANFMRNHFPAEEDDHLYTLENLVKANIAKKKMCLKSLMGDGRNLVTFVKKEYCDEIQIEDLEPTDLFQLASRISKKSFRCLNI
ncbi:hypothetical protein FQR65_LT10355 [Abscondita terminalis]|nr:hypothetical protein FQR65_LT10355 [Abscondita terminalis]